jgi:hypothetical protein
MTRISINLIRRLERLSDYNRLKYEWIDNLGDIVTSYDDDYYDLFSSTGVSSALEENLVVFGPDIDAAIRNLQRMMDTIDGYKDKPQEILDMPIMTTIRSEAARIARVLMEKNPNEGVTFVWFDPEERD